MSLGRQAGARVGSCQAVGDSVLYSRTWWEAGRVKDTPVCVFERFLSLEYGQVLREEHGRPWWLRR